MAQRKRQKKLNRASLPPSATGGPLGGFGIRAAEALRRRDAVKRRKKLRKNILAGKIKPKRRP